MRVSLGFLSSCDRWSDRVQGHRKSRGKLTCFSGFGQARSRHAILRPFPPFFTLSVQLVSLLITKGISFAVQIVSRVSCDKILTRAIKLLRPSYKRIGNLPEFVFISYEIRFGIER